MNHRIKYYSNSDLSTGWNLKKIEEIIENVDNKKDNYSINEIIEFYNITKFLDNEIYLKNWNENYIIKLKTKNKEIKAIIGKYCLSLNNKNISDNYKKTERNYMDDFFEIIEKYEIYNRIDSQHFSRLIKSTYNLELVLRNKKLTKYFTDVVVNQFFKYSDSIMILLDKYVLERFNKKELNIPNELTLKQREEIVIKYIRSKKANLNYLRVILNIQSNPNSLQISDKTKLLAKKRIDRDTKKIFEKDNGISMSTLVSFKENVEQCANFDIKGMDIKCEYDINWIKGNKDYPTVLNNFIYLFEYVDKYMRINLVNKESEDGFFEKISIRSQKEYKNNSVFQMKAMLSSIQMIAYCEQLETIGIRIEEIIKWFFEKYLKKEFNIKDYKINIPTQETSYLEKCRNILIEMDYILKEYKLFVEEGKINHELLEMSSTHMFFQDIPSKLIKKYVYASSDKFNLISYYFFSNQCMLAYLERFDEKYENFYKLISKEKVKLEDYPEYDQKDLKTLLDENYIEIDEDGYIRIANLRKLMIFKEIYYNDTVLYWNYSDESRKIIDELCGDMILKCESSLLSKSESDYFNYYLNKASFANGFDLRNKYIHGCQANGKDSEKIHKSNYYLLIKLLILLIIKINDDMSIFDSKKYKNNYETEL